MTVSEPSPFEPLRSLHREMECDVCLRLVSSRLPFHCVTCARSTLYEPRLEVASILLENEALSDQIEEVVRQPHERRLQDERKDRQKVDDTVLQTWSLEYTGIRRLQSERQKDAVLQHLTVMRRELEVAKAEIKDRRASISNRRADMDLIKSSVPQRRSTVKKTATETMDKNMHSWIKLHRKTAETRVFLCREAAALYRLKQKWKVKGGISRDRYTIGGIPVVDLREINGMKPEIRTGERLLD